MVGIYMSLFSDVNSELEHMDIFNILCLDPYETYNESMVKARIKRVALTLHPDKLNLVACVWQPPKGVSMTHVNILREFLFQGSQFLAERWAHIASCGKAGWRSTWDFARDVADRSRPIQSYTNRFQPIDLTDEEDLIDRDEEEPVDLTAETAKNADIHGSSSEVEDADIKEEDDPIERSERIMMENLYHSWPYTSSSAATAQPTSPQPTTLSANEQ